MIATAPVVTRFAPSPTGYLHLGHGYSALFAVARAREAGGRFLLRIEDIDRGRCRAEYECAAIEDLAWLGLEWEQPVRRQSDHMADYARAIDSLDGLGVLYPCFCTRAEIAAEVAAAARAPHGPDGPRYPGTCRRLSDAERAMRVVGGRAYALRLDVEMATDITGSLSWTDLDKGVIEVRPEAIGDVVIARKDTPTSYHLAVTVDDQLQGVSLVTRGDDLFHATDVHRLLQALLGYATPIYRHHALLSGADGRRLAKRDAAKTLRELRAAGLGPDDVRALMPAAGR
ncbi:MAG: tRNA glutamyl-Q(34) synthetase GluQRS [Rhodospirillales bacterium]|jgi:glutamyl-Q tRNA(Asp) synthetase|nr:tRNA glutamyl-Q(34) synthetase GluQRS [Rhodospirillales bacterium]